MRSWKWFKREGVKVSSFLLLSMDFSYFYILILDIFIHQEFHICICIWSYSPLLTTLQLPESSKIPWQFFDPLPFVAQWAQ